MHYRKHAQKFDTFCEIWVLTPSFFGTSLRSHYPIFSPQIKQKKLAYILLFENTKLFMRQIRNLVFRLFYVPISPIFCGQYILGVDHFVFSHGCVHMGHMDFIRSIFVIFFFQSYLGSISVMGAQWLSGRVLDSRPKGRWREPHRRHCVVVLGQDTFILA